MRAARTLEQNHVALAGYLPQLAASLVGIFKKKRGVNCLTGFPGSINQMAGRAAYANEHINPCPGDVATYVVVQGLGPTPEFEHLPQHSDAPLGWCIPEHVDHYARRVGIGVVAIVQNQNAFVPQPFSAHRAGQKFAHDAGKLVGADAEYSCHGDSSEQIRDAVFAWERAFKLSAAYRKAYALDTRLHIFRANIRAFTQAERDHPAAVCVPESGHQWIVGVQYRHAVGPQS